MSSPNFMLNVHRDIAQVAGKFPFAGGVVSVGHLIISAIQMIASGVLSLIALIFSKLGFESFTSLRKQSVEHLQHGAFFFAVSLLNIMSLGCFIFGWQRCQQD